MTWVNLSNFVICTHISWGWCIHTNISHHIHGKDISLYQNANRQGYHINSDRVLSEYNTHTRGECVHGWRERKIPRDVISYLLLIWILIGFVCQVTQSPIAAAIQYNQYEFYFSIIILITRFALWLVVNTCKRMKTIYRAAPKGSDVEHLQCGTMWDMHSHPHTRYHHKSIKA